MSSASSLFARSLALACAATVALAGCGLGQSPEPAPTRTLDAAAAPGTVTASATPSTAPTERTTPTPGPDHTATTQTPSTSPSGLPKLDATASISIAAVDPSTGHLVVGGYVTGLFEDGGDCQYSVTRADGGTPVVVHTIGVANVDQTSCGSTSIPKDQLKAGTYSVVLTYTNSAGAASSGSVTVKVAS